MKKSLFEYLDFAISTSGYREESYEIEQAEVSPEVVQKVTIHMICDEGFTETEKSAEMKQVKLISPDREQIFIVEFFRFTPVMKYIKAGTQTLLRITLKTKVEG